MENKKFKIIRNSKMKKMNFIPKKYAVGFNL